MQRLLQQYVCRPDDVADTQATNNVTALKAQLVGGQATTQPADPRGVYQRLQCNMDTVVSTVWWR